MWYLCYLELLRYKKPTPHIRKVSSDLVFVFFFLFSQFELCFILLVAVVFWDMRNYANLRERDA